MDVSVEREADGRFAVKLQADAVEVTVRASSRDFMRLTEIRSADWSQRRSIAVGESAGAPVFWASGDDHAALMIGHDDETGDVRVTLPFDVVGDRPRGGFVDPSRPVRSGVFTNTGPSHSCR